MRGRHTLAAVCGVLCLLVSACGGNAKPQPLPRPTASLSPSASPTPPVMPAAAKEKTKAGAIAFARHFVDVINYAGATGDTSRFEALARADVHEMPSALLTDIDEIYAAGGSMTGADGSSSRLSPRKHPSHRHGCCRRQRSTYGHKSWSTKAGRRRQSSSRRAARLPAFRCVWPETDGWEVSRVDRERMSGVDAALARCRCWRCCPASAPGRTRAARASARSRRCVNAGATAAARRSESEQHTHTRSCTSCGRRPLRTAHRLLARRQQWRSALPDEQLPAGAGDLPPLAGGTATCDSARARLFGQRATPAIARRTSPGDTRHGAWRPSGGSRCPRCDRTPNRRTRP